MLSNRYALSFLLAVGALGVAGAAGCSSDDRPTLGSDSDELTQAQCSFFAEGDKVQICHRTGSARNPYNIIRTNIASCGGHSGHAGDYITSTNPADPEYDPTCNGQGCFPEGAPFDGSVECCAGLSASLGGVCTDVDECATNNGGCGADFTCADGANPGDAPTCTQIDNCAPNPCVHGTCTDGVNSYTCACAPGFTGPNCDTPIQVCGDGIVQGSEQCDDGNTASCDGCTPTCTIEAPSTSTPSHQWTFNDGTAHDSVGGANGQLFNGASIAGGALVVDNLTTGQAASNPGQYMQAALPDSVSTRTLVAWVDLVNLTQHGGGALTIENTTASPFAQYFDSIVYAEQVPGQWMAGSDNFVRTFNGDNGGAAESSTDSVMVAIVYGADNRITIYRNGAPYASYTKGSLQTYVGGSSDALIGLRHSTCNFNCWLSGSIDEARIYPVALDQCQIAALQPVPQPPCPFGGSPFGDSCYVVRPGDLGTDGSENACHASYPGGHLASIHSQAENDFVGELLDPNGVGFITGRIGGTAPGTSFCSGPLATYAWTDGSTWNYEDWRRTTGEPSCGDAAPGGIQLWPDNAVNRAGQFGFSYVGWNDVPPTGVLENYVCKYPKP